MAKTTAPANPIGLDPGRTDAAIPAEAFGKPAALGLWAAAGVLLVGTMIDLGVLWLLQRQPSPQWEFLALANTLDAFPRIALGLALAYGALFVGRSTSLVLYRLLGGSLLLLAFVAAGLGTLILTDYLAIARIAGSQQEEALALLRTTTIKSLALGGTFTLLLLPIGLLGLRRPRR